MTASEREQWLARRVAKLESELYAPRALRVKERECPVCGDIVRTEGHGRPRLYCSDEHRRLGKLRSNRKANAKGHAAQKEADVAAKREAERGR